MSQDGTPSMDLRTLSKLSWVLSSGRFAVTAEIGPPRGPDPTEIRHNARMLKGLVDAYNITDNQTAVVRMSSIAASKIVLDQGVEPIMQMRMETQTGRTGAKTIAQFLIRHGRYDGQTGIYRLSDKPKASTARTVIIDEASMLTEEQLGAVLDAMKGCQRLVLVGDPRQLPPIGTGRPFLDVVRSVEPEGVESKFPRVGPCYAELTVRRRQVEEERDDLLLAEWFNGRSSGAGGDEIWEKILTDADSEHLRLVEWQDAQDLQRKLLEVLAEELGLQSVDLASQLHGHPRDTRSVGRALRSQQEGESGGDEADRRASGHEHDLRRCGRAEAGADGGGRPAQDHRGVHPGHEPRGPTIPRRGVHGAELGSASRPQSLRAVRALSCDLLLLRRANRWHCGHWCAIMPSL